MDTMDRAKTAILRRVYTKLGVIVYINATYIKPLIQSYLTYCKAKLCTIEKY